MVITLVNEILGIYPLNAFFTFENGPVHEAVNNFNVASEGVIDEVGLYFIYAPYNNNVQNKSFLTQRINGNPYTLVYIGKAGMRANGQLNNGQMLRGRMRNLGSDGITRRSLEWTNFMNLKGLNHLLFKWCVTANPNAPLGYDNCLLLEQSFCKAWTAVPEYKPEMNSM
jgi:hypothetical protein